MIIDFKLPDLGEGVTEAEIVRWLVEEGQSVAEDAPMVEVATIKATVEIPFPVGGLVRRLAGKQGDLIEVGATLIEIETVAGEDRPMPKPPIFENVIKPAVAVTSAPAPAAAVSDVPAPSLDRPKVRNENFQATPMVRRMAADHGVDLAEVTGTGAGGRITEDDVRAVLQAREHEAARLEKLADRGEAGVRERISLSGVRAATAQHMIRAAQVPTVTVADEADFTALDELRKSRGHTYLPYVVRAMVLGVKAIPRINAMLHAERDELVVYDRVNVGIAVQTEAGLLVPILESAETLGIDAMHDGIAALAEATRNRTLAPSQTRGGTITITSAGRFANLFATPLLHVPQVAIVGLHRVEDRAVVINGGIHVRKRANLTVSFDHRALDGSDASRFLLTVIRALEQPDKLY